MDIVPHAIKNALPHILAEILKLKDPAFDEEIYVWIVEANYGEGLLDFELFLDEDTANDACCSCLEHHTACEPDDTVKITLSRWYGKWKKACSCGRCSGRKTPVWALESETVQ